MQIKTRKRYHYTSIRMTKIYKSVHTKYWGGMQELELSYTAGGNVKRDSHFGKIMGSV